MIFYPVYILKGVFNFGRKIRIFLTILFLNKDYQEQFIKGLF